MADYFEKYVAACHIIESLKKEYSESEYKKKISEKDIEIGKLKSKVNELRHKNFERLSKTYSNMSNSQKKNFKKSYKGVLIKNQRNKISLLEEKIIELNKITS